MLFWGPSDFHCMDKISLNGFQNIFCSTEVRKSYKFWMTQGDMKPTNHSPTNHMYVTRQKRLKSSISYATCELLVHVEKEKQTLVFLCNPAIDNEQSRGWERKLRALVKRPRVSAVGMWLISSVLNGFSVHYHLRLDAWGYKSWRLQSIKVWKTKKVLFNIKLHVQWINMI